MEEEQEKKKTHVGLAVSLGISGALFLFLIGLIIFFNSTNVPYAKYLQKTEKTPIIAPEGILTPSEILENKMKYKGQKLTLRGRVFQEPMVCEKKECPREDPCCGCKKERNLVVADPDKVLTDRSIWRLRLLNPDAEAICERKESCEYDCPGWKMDGVYDITGTFFADPPPVGSGWKMFLDFYFEVESKEMIKELGSWDKIGSFVKEAIASVKRFFTGSQYVLP